ncbi:MAG: O-antigen ligase family protein, partial [Lachnospiraceae bacterium]|nr:O-antigen ligase family protein [Lachnospiraceae bacterium]
FFQGMLNGMIVWFFVQQIIAFGFRPYDYARYRGLYSGETQNGLFYMLVYCAFLLKWWLAEEKKAHRLWRLFYFVMAAGCVGFMILTGGRTALVGAVIITLLLYTYYFIFQKKSFWSWLLKGIALVLCIVVMFPAVYGCVRYLPTILHHPVWFEGEYNADTSVHSYDPWNSERYITFEKVLELNAGRLLQLFGIDLKELQAKKNSSVGAMKVEAAETAKPTSIAEPASTAQPTATPKPVETAMPEVTPTPVVTPTAKPVVELGSGETPEDPYIKENFPSYNSVKIRRILYRYYITHLNWQGHIYDDGGFILRRTRICTMPIICFCRWPLIMVFCPAFCFWEFACTAFGAL